MPELTYREAVRDALSTAMRQDEDVFIMGEDIAEMGGSMGVTAGMLDEFGKERVRNTPISEMALAGAAIGAAMQGMRPVAEIMYEDFMTLAAEQVVNQAAKLRYMSGGQLTVPVVFRTQGGAGWSPGAQHAQQLEAWFVHIPGLKVVFASTHEAVTRMGFGAEVASVIQYQAFDWLDAPIERVGAKFAPLPFAPVMEQFVVPHADDVLAAIMRTVGRGD